MNLSSKNNIIPDGYWELAMWAKSLGMIAVEVVVVDESLHADDKMISRLVVTATVPRRGETLSLDDGRFCTALEIIYREVRVEGMAFPTRLKPTLLIPTVHAIVEVFPSDADTDHGLEDLPESPQGFSVASVA